VTGRERVPARHTHYSIVARSVKNMAEDQRWQNIVNDAAEIVKKSEDFASEKGLHFPKDPILKLVQGARDLQSAHQELGKVDESTAMRAKPPMSGLSC